MSELNKKWMNECMKRFRCTDYLPIYQIIRINRVINFRLTFVMKHPTQFNLPIGRIFSLTEYWNVFTFDINVSISVGTTSIKYCAIIELSCKIFSSPSNGWTIPAVASPKLNRLMRCVKFCVVSSNNALMCTWPCGKWRLLPPVMWKFPATLFNVRVPCLKSSY